MKILRRLRMVAVVQCGSETSTTLPPFELGLASDPSKQSMFNQIMHRFWEISNPKLNAGFSQRAGGTEAPHTSLSVTGGTIFTQQASSQNTVQRHKNHDEEDNLSDDGNRKHQKRPK
jgi:hypothetical protein